MDQIIDQNVIIQNKKLALLKISCFIGYVLAGLTIVVGLLFIVISGAPNTFRLFPEISFYTTIAGGKLTMSFTIFSLLLPMTAFFGVVILWYQRKIGFWIFTGAKVLLIALPFLLIDLPLRDLWLFVQPLLIITLILVILFGLNYKKMY